MSPHRCLVSAQPLSLLGPDYIVTSAPYNLKHGDQLVNLGTAFNYQCNNGTKVIVQCGVEGLWKVKNSAIVPGITYCKIPM